MLYIAVVIVGFSVRLRAIEASTQTSTPAAPAFRPSQGSSALWRAIQRKTVACRASWLQMARRLSPSASRSQIDMACQFLVCNFVDQIRKLPHAE
jgi:hypothetical protein